LATLALVPAAEPLAVGVFTGEERLMSGSVERIEFTVCV
jgi:hypothetical protein